jgi:hypothetical protein
MNEYKRLRFLNDHKGLFGLYLSDFMCALLGLTVLNQELMDSRAQILAPISALIVLAMLIPIRQKFRKGVIRDYLRQKIVPRVIYAKKYI